MDFYAGKNVTLKVGYIGSHCENLQKLFPEISHEKGELCFKDESGEIYTDLFYHINNFPQDKEIIIRGEFNVRKEGTISFISHISVVKSEMIE
ncbi:MAG: hypothetical protein DRO88_12235 [Promethearchaeia archaeon]|nr:MAG: hypothetical protein DRO88_12235 [Candidatus Lokiarchaeia archaeon]